MVWIGGLCGVTFVDEKLKEYVKQKGTDSFWEALPDLEIREGFQNTWENYAKINFERRDDRLWRLYFGGKKITLNSDEIADCFDGVISDVEQLVAQQVRKAMPKVSNMLGRRRGIDPLLTGCSTFFSWAGSGSASTCSTSSRTESWRRATSSRPSTMKREYGRSLLLRG